MSEPLTDAASEALQSLEALYAGGDSDWGHALMVYVLPQTVTIEGQTLAAGLYVREVSGSGVLAYRLSADASEDTARVMAERVEERYVQWQVRNDAALDY